MNETLFVTGLLVLIFFSYLDIKKGEVENEFIFAFLFMGLILSYANENLFSMGLGMALMAIVSIGMWRLDMLGGADSKLLIALSPYIFVYGIANTLTSFFFFIIEFGVIATIYGLCYRSLNKYETHIPLIPVITLTYCVFWFFKFY